jgi:hypothetical protein
MWKEAKKKNPDFKSITAKNSFFRGISEGYTYRIENQKKASASSTDLMIISKNLERQMHTVYSRIGHSSMSSGTNHSGAKAAGVESGKKLSIKPGIKSDLMLKKILPFFE